MRGYKILLEGGDESPATVELFCRGVDRDEARAELQALADHIDRVGVLPVQWDIAWPVPVAVVRRHRDSLRIRCDCFERETETGFTAGTGYLRIHEFEEEEES